LGFSLDYLDGISASPEPACIRRIEGSYRFMVLLHRLGGVDPLVGQFVVQAS
jgi:hypothetical protein